MKLLLLFLTIGTLTWLSHQDFSRLFNISRKMTLYFRGDYTLFTYQNTDRTAFTRVFAPEKTIFIDRTSNHPVTPWELYSISDQIDTNSTISAPPQAWHINTDSILEDNLPTEWPKPIVSHSNSIYTPEQYYLAQIDSSGQYTLLKIDSLIILIIKSCTENDKTVLPILFEKTDLIIIYTDSAQCAESIRQQFRPRLCISTSLPPRDHAPQSNMVFTSKQNCSIKCTISGKKNIKIIH